MQRVILVVSPDPDFLQQIRSHLEEGGRFQVTVANSAQDALNLANSDFFEVAILDSEIDDIPMVAFSRDLAALQTELKILVFPPDNNPQHPALDGLVANGFLTKPFSGPEIGSALSNLFSDQPTGPDPRVKQIDDLMKQWLQNPETGSKKADHILKSTTAQTVLIIIKGQTTASAGSTSENLVANVIGFLARYWKDDEDSELARFLRIDSDSCERFLYATKLVSNVVLVLVYPYTTTIQQVRRELNQVKDDFQRNYPTTAELRQDIAKQALAEINERNKKLESMQTFPATISQSELDELKLLQSQPKSKFESPSISEEELANLNKLIEEMPSPDPEPKNESESEPKQVVEAAKIPDWLYELDQMAVKSLPSTEPEKTPGIQTEKPLFEEPQPIDTVIQTTAPIADLPTETPPTTEAAVNKPAMDVNSLRETDNQATTPVTDLLTETPETAEAALNEPSAVVEPLPEIDFQLPWETEESEAAASAAIAETTTPEIPPVDFPQVDIASVDIPPVVVPQADTPPLVIEDNKIEEAQVEVPAIKLDEPALAAEEPELTPTLETVEPVAEAAEPVFVPPLEKSESAPGIEESVTEEPPVEEPVSNLPPELKDFRFNYTCILIPEGRDQFLTKDLAERLGVVMPQFHLAQGWRLTSITIRPQYMLWTLAVPMGTYPQKIIHDLRGLTSAHIFANFPEIAKKKTSDDFWSSNYLAVSGSEPPPVNLIYDFVAQAWKKKETNTP